MKHIIFTSFLSLILITSCSEFKQPYLGNGYKFISDGKYTLEIVDTNNTVKIESCILEYGFDSTFIIVSQRPWDLPGVSSLNKMTYYERNEAFENSTYKQYWIINKQEKSIYSLDSISMRARYSNVYGPYKKEEYILKLEELRVPKSLQLRKCDS